MKTITVVIDEHGESTVDLAGFNGKGCDAIQQGFARAVGSSTHEVKKPEYNRPCKTEIKLQNKS